MTRCAIFSDGHPDLPRRPFCPMKVGNSRSIQPVDLPSSLVSSRSLVAVTHASYWSLVIEIASDRAAAQRENSLVGARKSSVENPKIGLLAAPTLLQLASL
jgi:hypothetical protein